MHVMAVFWLEIWQMQDSVMHATSFTINILKNAFQDVCFKQKKILKCRKDIEVANLIKLL